MQTNVNRLLRLAALLVLPSLLAACGGRLGDRGDTGSSPPEDGGSPTVNAPEDAATASDASAPDDASPPEDAAVSCPALLSGLEHEGMPPEAFTRLEDFLEYFRKLATAYQLVIPAHGVDCAVTDAGECTYDVREPRLDASDIHYSNDLNQFTGPDGQPWVWTYIPDRNDFLAANQVTDPDAYACIVQLNAQRYADGG